MVNLRRYRHVATIMIYLPSECSIKIDNAQCFFCKINFRIGMGIKKSKYQRIPEKKLNSFLLIDYRPSLREFCVEID